MWGQLHYIIAEEDSPIGYTHYFHQQRDVTLREWTDIINDFTKLLEDNYLPAIQYESDDSSPPQIDYHLVRFNGVGDDGHETMILDPYNTDFEFCKTARKPYDLAVCALLLLAHHHAPGAWKIRSDGGPAEWARALQLAQHIIDPRITLPPDVED